MSLWPTLMSLWPPVSLLNTTTFTYMIVIPLAYVQKKICCVLHSGLASRSEKNAVAKILKLFVVFWGDFLQPAPPPGVGRRFICQWFIISWYERSH